MMHYLLELVLWMLLVFLSGCVIGSILRRMTGSAAAAENPPAPAQIEAETSPEPPPPPPAVIAPPPEKSRMARPKGLPVPRGGKPDNLQMISGIGPKNEKVLNNLGFYHFDQIAAWTPGQIGWIDDHLKFHGRVERQRWVRQAILLAEGKTEEFKTEFGSGRRG